MYISHEKMYQDSMHAYSANSAIPRRGQQSISKFCLAPFHAGHFTLVPFKLMYGNLCKNDDSLEE